MWRRRKISFSKWWSAAIPPQPSRVHLYYDSELLLERAHTCFGPVLSWMGGHMGVLGCYIYVWATTLKWFGLLYMSGPVSWSDLGSYIWVGQYPEVIWALIYEWACILKWILSKLNLLPPQWSEFLWSWIYTLKLQCIQFWKKKISEVSTESWSFRFKFLLLTSTKKQHFWCQ